MADFETIFIPDTVWNEVIKHRPEALPSNKVNFIHQSIIQSSEQVTALTPLYTLHKGEQDALHLCMEFERSLLLTDDTAARLAAKNIGVLAHGTLGLLVRAIRKKSLSKTEVLQLLRSIPAKTTLHIRATLLAEVISDVDRQAK
ncbi:MAG: DNA-binding protein [Methyloprofundus sp.]|nr:DNA-binding protein [Methyloprofundus sp.]